MTKRMWYVVLWLVIAIGSFIIITVPSLKWLTYFGDNVVIPAAFWGAICFILYYSILAPWWHTPYGRMVVSLDLAVMLTLLAPVMKEEFSIDLAKGTTIRLTVAALLIVAITIATRIWLVGKLHHWWPEITWKRKKPVPNESGLAEAETH